MVLKSNEFNTEQKFLDLAKYHDRILEGDKVAAFGEVCFEQEDYGSRIEVAS